MEGFNYLALFFYSCSSYLNIDQPVQKDADQGVLNTSQIKPTATSKWEVTLFATFSYVQWDIQQTPSKDKAT